LTTITISITEASRKTHSASIDTSGAERAVDEADRSLKRLEILIEIDGKNALREAKEAQAKLGHQSNRMTDIAQEARNISYRFVLGKNLFNDFNTCDLNARNKLMNE